MKHLLLFINCIGTFVNVTSPHTCIWCKGGNRDKTSKMKAAKQGHTWFLKERWNELHSNMIVVN